MNVLITSAGRRTSLVSAFQAAAHSRGGKVVAVETDGLANALYQADVIARVPPVGDENYIPELLGVIEANQVRLVVPTIDPELPILARASHFIESAGAVALISDLDLIQVLGDKVTTETFFLERGVPIAPTWLPHALPADLPHDLFVKPRFGSASKHAYSVSRPILERILPMVPDPVVQPQLSGQEITVDALIDLEGRPIHYVPRTRLRTLGGESIQSETLPSEDLEDWVLGVLGHMTSAGARGPQTIQAFLTDDGPIVTDVNPRFGGGVPLTFEAGGAYPEWLLEMVEGRQVAPRLGQYEEGLYMTRVFAESFTRQPWW